MLIHQNNMYAYSGYTVLEYSVISVVADGKKITFSSAKPFKDTNRRLQVPLRSIGEALGAETTWTESTQTATFKISDTVSSFTVGQKLYKVNGTSITMDTSVVKKNNSLYAPARLCWQPMRQRLFLSKRLKAMW